MSTNFNLAMLRNLHEPVSQSLDAAIVQLSQYSAGTMDPSAFSGAHHAHLVNGSLSVIGCRAASRVAGLLEQAMAALPAPQNRGWDHQKAVEVARLCQDLASQLLEHINRILSDMEDLPVRMWPAYRDLSEQLALPVPATPEDLYEPDPNFQNLKFAPLAQDYLSSVTKGAISRLKEAIEKVESSSSKQEMETGLQAALKVFDWIYSLRHARGYQAYWLALSARISVGLLDPETQADKGPWSVLLGEALLELEKFSRNNRRVDPDLLGKTIRPLVARWPAHWTQSHPTLAETNERLGISLFWETLDDVQSSQQSGASTTSNEMPAIIEQMKLAWGRYVVAEGSDPSRVLAQSVAAFREAYPQSVLSHAGVGGLLTSVMSAMESLPPPGEVPDSLSVEFAAAMLLLEDALEGRGRNPSISDSQSSLQRRRLHASLTGDSAQLSSLPCLRWDDKKYERMLRAASTSAFAQVQKDISEIEDSLVERLRDDHVSLDMSAISRRANQAAQVLEMLDARPAATIAAALVGLVERVDRNPGKEPGTEVTLAIAALGTFLSARQSGDGEATHLLAEAYQAVRGEPMPYGYATEVDVEEVKRAAAQLVGSSDTPPAPVEQPQVEAAPEQAPPSRREPTRFDPATLDDGVRVVRAGQPTEAFFLEEMEHVLAEIALQRGVLSSDQSDEEARQTLRRQFHTIKGSSRIAGFDAIGHAAQRVENYLDSALLSRPAHTPDDEQVVSRAVSDMKAWFANLSSNSEAVVSTSMIDAWFQDVQIQGDLPDQEQSDHTIDSEEPDLAERTAAPVAVDVPAADEPAADEPAAPPVAVDVPAADEPAAAPVAVDEPAAAPVAVDDVEVIAIAGYGSMEYETYYSLTEDLHKSLGALDDIASASPDDHLQPAQVEQSLKEVMQVGESMGIPALARLPRAMLENVRACVETGQNPEQCLFASQQLASAARSLGSVIRSLCDDRQMSLVDTQLLEALQADTQFMRARANPAQEEDFIAGLTMGMEDADQPSMAPDTTPAQASREEASTPAEQANSQDQSDLLDAAGDQPGETAAATDPVEDDLWDQVFDNFEQISECLRKIGPLLVALSERRK